jgi:hyaluronoglucosaminidase
VRGVVEGFYGTPWAHEARLDVISFLAPRGMNAYVYAPKDDAKHRAQWRTGYDDAELAGFAEVAASAAGLGVRFGFAISPGLDITYEAEADRAGLLAKLEPMRANGVTWFLLLVDDIPMQPGLAPRQAELVSWLHEALHPCAVTVCPTEYVGTRPSPYLSALSAALPPDVDLMWTGPTVCSPEITAEDARRWTKAVDGHGVLVWDNTPVNDALMTNCLHLGPYRGRDADLVDVVSGVLCNPMTQALASKIPLATAMDFLADPDGYDPSASWARAIADVGGARAAPLAVLARACADSPIARPDTLDLARKVDVLAATIDRPEWPDAAGVIATELRAARSLGDALAPGPTDPLLLEVAPWSEAARTEAEAGLAALRLLQQVRPVATVGGPGEAAGRAAAPDPETAMRHAFVVLFLWAAARADEKVVYGPRFVVYTPVIQLADGSPGLDAAVAVREDANAVDRLCRLALATYDVWRITAAGEPLRVLVGDTARDVAADGTFEAGGETVLVCQGSLCTRADAGRQLPFPDVRLGPKP